MQGLGFLPGAASSWAMDVSGDGSVIVGNSNSQAFRWTAATGMRTLDVIGNFVGANAVTPDGSKLVGFGSSPGQPLHAVVWIAAGGLVSLGDIPGGTTSSTATDISADGRIIVGQANTGLGDANGSEAMFWDAQRGMQRLATVLSDNAVDTTGWTLINANAVSADGRTMVGQGRLNGEVRGWVATVPEPSSAGSIAALLLLGASRRRRQA